MRDRLRLIQSTPTDTPDATRSDAERGWRRESPFRWILREGERPLARVYRKWLGAPWGWETADGRFGEAPCLELAWQEASEATRGVRPIARSPEPPRAA